MYIYKTDLYLYENVYCSINQSTMYFKAEIKTSNESNGEMEFFFFLIHSAVVKLVSVYSVLVVVKLR